jgi:O-antigen ligase
MMNSETPYKILKVATFLIMLTVPLAFSTHLDSSFLIAKQVLFKALLLIMIPAVVYMLLTGTCEARIKRLIGVPLICYLAANSISTIFSINFLSSIERFIELFSYGAVFYIWCKGLRREDTGLYIKATVVAGFLSSIYALCQHAGIDFPGILWSQQDMVRHRSIGTFGNPTFLAGFLVMVFPLMLSLFLTDQGSLRRKIRLGKSEHMVALPARAFYGITLLSAFIAIIMTYTRGAWVALVFSTVFLLCFAGKKIVKTFRREFLSLAVAVIILILCVLMQQMNHRPSSASPEYRHTVVERFMSIGNINDLSVDRFFLWKIGYLNFRDHMLIGTGPGSFPCVFPEYRYHEPPANRGRIAVPEACHNEFIEIASATGILGLLSYLALLIAAFCLGFRLSRHAGEEEQIQVACFLAALLAYLIHGFFLYSTISSNLLFWFLLSLLARESGVRKEDDESRPLNSLPRIMMVITTALCFVLLCLNVRTALGSYYMNEAKKAQESQKWKESLTYFDRAIFFDPWQHKYHLQRGKMLEGLFMSKPLAVLPPEILHSYSAAISLNPRDPYSRADMGRFYGYLAERFDRSKADEAVENYKAAIKLDRYNPLFYNDLGNFLMVLGRDNEALEYYRGGLEIEPDSPILNFNMALHSWKRKDSASTRSYLEKSLKANPSYVRAQQLLQEVESFEKKK